jgi:hypothetical protein
METLIYGLPQFEKRDYMEILLSTQCQTEEDINLVIEKAKLAGFHSFRIAYYNGEKPNFTNTINI